MVNLGCGSVYHESWVNIDIKKFGPEVEVQDLRNGIPYADNYFDVVYHSNLLEHIPKNDGVEFLKECYRVLNTEGILRIVIPDLEQIAKNYILKMEAALENDESARYDYDWMMIELIDQTTRTKAGGLMKEYLTQDEIKNIDFVKARIGPVVEYFRALAEPKYPPKKSILSKLSILKRYKEIIAKVTLSALYGKQGYNWFKEGRFRNSGEVHQWMYDRYSITRTLSDIGFQKVKILDAYSSDIPNFEDYNLDIFENSIRKPDGLFVEAIK